MSSPISEALKNIASLDDKAAFASLVAQMHKEGSSPFFQLYVGADEKNSSMNSVNLYQSGMSMGDRDYYLSEDSANVKIRMHIKNILMSCLHWQVILQRKLLLPKRML